ncbi:MAG TPA: DUF2924 domain-containing protein [Acetobacteraceae bacterium]|jgi:hypothetical protein|nr:DUF2924 domain-containing protein [Acetobacteraceae bacterium]
MARRRGEAVGAGPSLPLADFAAALARLPALDITALRTEWERLHGRPPFSDLTRDLLLRGIAHRLQESAFGGLSPATLRQLESPGASAASGWRRQTEAGPLKPGTVLVRSWGGATHTVTMRANGFEYQGRLYRSLSLVAGEITRSHRSGPRFFGLTQTTPPPRPGQAGNRAP